MFKPGDVVRYEGDQHPWGHAVVVKTSDVGVTIDLDHVGLVPVTSGDLTLHLSAKRMTELAEYADNHDFADDMHDGALER